jgi:hypothetical protein
MNSGLQDSGKKKRKRVKLNPKEPSIEIYLKELSITKSRESKER